MQPPIPTTSAALLPVPPAPRRRTYLHKLVRELAGWTLPPRPATTSRPPDGWSLAWPTR